MTNAQLTVREAVFDLLRGFGMTTIFGNPGSTELPMFKDFPEDFQYVLGLQESVVLGMADGFSQATRNAALVNLHSAAGVGHALGNLFTAYRNQSPVVVTAGQQSRSILPLEPFLFAQSAAEFPKPYVKWSCEPAGAAEVPAAIARAVHVAMQPPRGPTFVSIPIDDWDRGCEPVPVRQVSTTIRADEELLAAAAQALASAKRPVFVVGAALAREDAWDEVVALAERHEAPVWASPRSSRNSFPEDHRLFAGFLPADREAIVARLDGNDCVLVLGAPVFTYHVEGSGPVLPECASLYQLADDPTAIASAAAGTGILTSLKAGIRDLLAGPEPSRRAAPPPRFTPARLSGTPFTDAYVLQQLAELRPTGSIIVEEAPSSRPAMNTYLPITERDGFYTCASGGLGHGLPAAIGVALGRPGEKVIALLGDGSSMYAIQGLWSAAQLRLPIAFVILKNGRYESLVHFARHFGMPRMLGTELPETDFCAIAKGARLPAERVDGAAGLDQVLSRVLQADGPGVIEIVVESDDAGTGAPL